MPAVVKSLGTAWRGAPGLIYDPGLMAVTQVDLVVVGAGAAGLSATIEAAGRGLRVAVLEADHELGGTASTAAAGTLLAGSPIQSRAGIRDSADLALADWLAWGGPSVDQEWAGRYLESSVSDLFGWWSGLGVRWQDVLRRQEGNSVPRWHSPRGGGRAVMAALGGAAMQYRSVAWALGTRVTEILMGGGRVVGVSADGPAGHAEFRAPAVLLACGGFTNDLSMVRRHASGQKPPDRILLGGGRGAQGDGHRLLQAVGAQFVNLDAIWMYPYATPDYLDDEGARGLAVRGLDGDIWVNSDGLRFHNEALRGGASGTPALLAQRGSTCWSIIDARIAGAFHVADPAYRDGLTPRRAALDALLTRSPYVSRADGIRELAAEAGIDGDGLDETVRAHNRQIAAGSDVDTDFARPLSGLQPLVALPFYAIQFFPLARKNLGGVRTTSTCEVVGTNGAVVPGLLAAGELAGMAGGSINGRAALEGTMFGPSSFSGRVAGRQVLA